MFEINPIFRTFSVFSGVASTLGKSYIKKDITQLKKDWAVHLLRHLNVELQIIGQPVQAGPLLTLGNHISYLDIPILISAIPKISFLSKAEIKSWPLIGRAASKMDTIFVQRDSANSRKISRAQVTEALLNLNSVIAGFPSGTTTLNELKPWRTGLFEIAFQHQIPVQPFRIQFQPLRKVAYIDDDQFVNHLYQLVKLPKITATIEFHPPTKIIDPLICSQKWQSWTQNND